ncbi:hypothetical protein [Sphingomicrobium flavum]|nr:hypothetical protein [Sphingomicrobium flavum]
MIAKLNALAPKCHVAHAAIPLTGVLASFVSLGLVTLTLSSMMMA